MDGRNVLHATRVPRLLRETQLAAMRLEGRLLPAPRHRSLRPGEPLRILACTPTYLPDHRRGAEITLHLVLRELAGRGLDARVLLTEPGPSGSIDGIEVLAPVAARSGRARELGRWCDLVIGQLGARGFALGLGARCRRPVAYFMHIGNIDRRALFGHPDLTVFPSTTVLQQYPSISPSTVVHPPVPPEDYATTRGDAITLVTHSASKGARVFDELARRLPDRPFLTTGGGDGAGEPLPNVTALDPVRDMRSVYAQTRILVMPSVYESYGRVGLEAAASGIPTIAHPAEGIREALGEAGVFVDRGDVDAWVDAIERLDDPTEYQRRSALARDRVANLDPAAEIDSLEAQLRALVSARAR